MSRFTRRRFLYTSALATAALPFQGLIARAAIRSSDYADLIAANGQGGYGPLYPVKSKNTAETLLALPEGFQYTVLGKAGAPMADKSLTPARHDGMAAFAYKGRIRLVRNQEVNNRVATQDIAFGNRALAYDVMAAGGTTTLEVDPKTRELIRDFVSLSGTLQNCAGGPTPWGSWITCEETMLGQHKFTDSGGREWGGFSRSHGYCFEVSAFSEGQVAPVALKQMGRFVHEAIAVDPATGIVYETEDMGMAGFYRFIPKKKGRLAEGGRLQMLAVKGKPNYDARTGQKTAAALAVVWVDIDEPDPAAADTDPSAVRKQGFEKGGATFSRLEGCWHGNGRVYFTSTSGGDKRLGQVWEYKPTGKDAGYLSLIFESPSVEILDGPDNVCISPRGGLILCEDGSGDQFLRGLTPKGRIFDFAKNVTPAFSRGEWAGATFSPDGETLFANLQTPGVTLAIWGPWKRGAL